MKEKITVNKFIEKYTQVVDDDIHEMNYSDMAFIRFIKAYPDVFQFALDQYFMGANIQKIFRQTDVFNDSGFNQDHNIGGNLDMVAWNLISASRLFWTTLNEL